ncbi:MAG TPA: PQQ-binding-like beta-propeller repeat protein [Thermoplasmata archaeon]|nr:PQQ-binding-like beta-propeller repeat protein [Thermoplasmata archaeon]
MTTESRRLPARPAWRAAVGIAIAVAALAATPALASGRTVGGHAPAASGVLPALGSPNDWTTFHGSENRSGFVTFPGPTVDTPLWGVCLGGSSSTPIRVGPVANATRIYVGDVFGHFVGLNQSGAKLWSTTIPTDPTTAELVPPFVVVGLGDGNVTALGAENGAVAWSTGLGGRVVGGIATDGNLVYAGTTTGTVAALDLATGAVVWRTALGSGVAGTLALDGGRLFASTANGNVTALTTAGAVVWSHPVGASLEAGPAVAFGRTVIGDRGGNLTALWESNGTVDWRYSVAALRAGDAIESTPAVGQGRVVASTDLGTVVAVNVTDGGLLWSRATGYTGYPELASPALAPNGAYVVDAYENLDDFNPANGQLLWSTQVLSQVVYSSPALERGHALIGNDLGCLYDFGPNGAAPVYPVSGTVVDPTGAPVAGASVDSGVSTATTGPNGAFVLELANGTYLVTASAAGYPPVGRNIVVAGPTANLTFVLVPPATFAVSGSVLDGASGRSLAGLLVVVVGAYDYSASTTTAPDGGFVVPAPNGTALVSVGPPTGFAGGSARVQVAGTGVHGVRIALRPTAAVYQDPVGWNDVGFALPIVAALAGALVLHASNAWRRQRAEGLQSTSLSPIATFVAMRAILLVVQAVAVLVLLYLFGTYLPARGFGFLPWTLDGNVSHACTWADWGCSATAFLGGLGVFVWNLFTGQWGQAQFGNLHAPALDFLRWWLPSSLELAAITLAISAAIAYALGLLAGWRRESPLDYGVRAGSLVGLLVPTFLVLILLYAFAAAPYQNQFSDSPYGLIPTPAWFSQHGGFPAWIGPAANTLPTGFPIVDGAIHLDATFEVLTLTKTLLQAVVIALVYTAIFLRYARHAVASTAGEPHVRAARARGLTERTLLWRHAGRRVLPLYALIFGITLPVYLGTQAVVEAFSNDTGVGALFLSEITHVGRTGFGFSAIGGGPSAGNFYQVTVFLLVLIILVGNLCSDVLARYLDPRLLGTAR